VPADDELADTKLRVSEILGTLTIAEKRSAADIAGDIATPFDDVQVYQTSPDGGMASLPGALHNLQSIRDLISATVRTVAEGPAAVFSGSAPALAGEVLQTIRLGPGRPDSQMFTVRIPVHALSGQPEGSQGNGAPLGRQIGLQLHAALLAMRAAAARATDQNLIVFDEAVPAGVSANMCEALSGLAGRQHAEAFEIAFRWGRGLPSAVPADNVRFPGGTGAVIRAGASRLRELSALGARTITGMVESLHGKSPGEDRWEIKVRGELASGRGAESVRSVWVSLDSPAAYDRAIAAHRRQRGVRGRGELAAVRRRGELLVSDNDFQVIEIDYSPGEGA
jgi:hypothetical protein